MMCPYYDDEGVTIYHGDVREVLPTLPAESIDCVVTSPPYWNLRDYGVDGQIGLEESPEVYVQSLVEVFREVRRAMKGTATLWVNLGDTYSSGGHGGGGSPDYKPKDLVGIPWMIAFALRDDGWYLRQDIIWHKPSAMPESVKDRCTKSHDYVFLLAKSERYYFDWEAIAEPSNESNAARPRMGQGPNTKYAQKRKEMKVPQGWDTGEGAHGNIHKEGRTKGTKLQKSLRDHKIYPAGESERGDIHGHEQEHVDIKNKRSVWTIPPVPYPKAHFATFPPKLVEPCILAGCPEGGTVLDPFLGSGTTAHVAKSWGRKCIGIEISEEYCELAVSRFEQRSLFS